MNIELIKEYINIRKAVEAEGVIEHISPRGVQVAFNKIVELPNLKVEHRKCEHYPYMVSTEIDGAKLFAIFNSNEAEHPAVRDQVLALEGYMIEDIRLEESEVM